MDKVEAAWATMAQNLERTSGRSLDGWIALVREQGLERHGAITKYLRSEHGLTGGFANFIALRALATDEAPSGDALVDQMYSGRNAPLRPIHDAVVKVATGLGADVQQAPKQAWVSLRRQKQFAMIGPGTRGRVDVCLNLADVPPAGRLEVMTGMATRRVRIGQPSEIDDELAGWLRAAYDRAGAAPR